MTALVSGSPLMMLSKWQPSLHVVTYFFPKIPLWKTDSFFHNKHYISSHEFELCKLLDFSLLSGLLCSSLSDPDRDLNLIADVCIVFFAFYKHFLHLYLALFFIDKWPSKTPPSDLDPYKNTDAKLVSASFATKFWTLLGSIHILYTLSSRETSAHI